MAAAWPSTWPLAAVAGLRQMMRPAECGRNSNEWRQSLGSCNDDCCDRRRPVVVVAAAVVGGDGVAPGDAVDAAVAGEGRTHFLTGPLGSEAGKLACKKNINRLLQPKSSQKNLALNSGAPSAANGTFSNMV